ncbi:uncharacterized protein LOC130621878 [Hydractinia symbiolongicarpus]|uniref:uncharacterized protein LOC130621878 n=1 Tax=Hydractinia symbiolongicarpus TaxID=13093 RepID=UPI00254E9D7C|nr:uncharacterized protein LOC130621878 [Hydractinia symbiolongicarpus]XP_057293221.1 uncharacterized protein LOC130621878 [Hydractinia symbiolongicarpus]XP_057293222.1 uncharacterized protein LOC130621878 [Hydractinia symbiolongicarpus]XP_057293223.1 uncharacterized protein LOC130621878 [Hydractinia symbiolongicarpus]
MATSSNFEPPFLMKGLVFKSPPEKDFDRKRWHERWCTLKTLYTKPKSLKKKKKRSSIRNALSFRLSSSNTEEKASSEASEDDAKEYMVFSYYEKEQNDTPIQEFIVDGANVTKHAGGIHNYKYAIEIKLSNFDNNRLIYLCHKEDKKHEHEQWLEALLRKDKLDGEDNDNEYSQYTEKSEVFIPDENNPILQNLRRTQEKMLLEESYDVLQTDTLCEEINRFQSGKEQTDSGISGGSDYVVID